MGYRVDARDVLDANAKVRRSFRGRVVGEFRRTGPNGWDPYELARVGAGEGAGGQAVELGEQDVHAGLRVQVEDVGTELRLRSDGRVLVVAWEPGDEDPEALRDAPSATLRAYFLSEIIEPFDELPGMGAAAVIARALTRGRQR